MRNSIQQPVCGTRTQRSRAGAMALTLLIFYLFVMFGLIVISIDLGYILQTRTQLQAIADATTLSGGTELKSGLGDDPESPATVVAAGSLIAVEYAAKHRNGDQYPTYINAERDVHFGWAKYDTEATPPGWVMNWDQELPGIGGYNLIGTIIRRDQVDSTNGDGPLPLLFAPLLGKDFNNITADAAAVIMPASGIRIPPGSPTTSNVIPFAIDEYLWFKYLRAQAVYKENGGAYPVPFQSVRDTVPNYNGILEPLFGHVDDDGNDAFFIDDDDVPYPDYMDRWNCGCVADDADSGPPMSAAIAGGDGILEVDIYPHKTASGNFGTIDIGTNANETRTLGEQIEFGVTEVDLSYHTNNEIQIPGTVTGETGISVGIKGNLDAIVGQCRTVLLFDVVSGTGNTAVFDLVGMAGVRIMDSKLTGSAGDGGGEVKYKHISIQRCNATLSGGTGDYEDPPGEHTTVFTPLILIE
ncbi:MAG: hypothetical protein COA78_09165 [Blastopirellula sp.]|nr:MAG: hypothetical protein COA78_09165 [Blastopirellula sp.]